MQVKILGSGAGGGFPQWNCACANCSAFRAGRFRGSARTQTQIAVRASASPDSPAIPPWVLINASPDLRGQILADRDFSPRKSPRHSPIEAVVLTGAEIDQVMGLLHLREFQPLSVFCTRKVEAILRDGTSIFRTLNSVDNQVKWRAIKTGQKWSPVANGANGKLTLEAFAMDGKAPAYVGYVSAESVRTASGDEVIGLSIECDGKKILCAPNLPSLDAKMIKIWNEYDVLLVDGTFWADDELRRVVGSGKLAQEMGHVPMSGADGTLKRLAKVKKPSKIFVHINNTNPVLNEESAEHQKVLAAGWELAFDGMEIELK